MSYDFSGEETQREYVKIGPVPAGSIVITRMKLLDPVGNSAAPENPLIKMASSGLRMLYVELEVTEGRYAGCTWRQTITLPVGFQKIGLSENQESACRIGGSILKAVLEASRKSLNVNDLLVFDGLKFPTKVRINRKARTSSSGTVYWVNEIAQIITPDKKEYEEIARDRELINPDGATEGDPPDKTCPASQAASKSWGEYAPSEDYNDVVPF